MLNIIYESWDSVKLVNSSMISYSYDQDNNLVGETHLSLNDSTWVNSWKNNSTYDDNHNLLEKIVLLWKNKTWANISKYSYSYDDSSHVLTYKIEDWTDSSWVNSQISTYTYDIFGNPSSQSQQSWINNNWIDNFKYTFNYNQDGSLIYALYENWLNDGSLKSRQRINISYDTCGNILSKLTELWKTDNWENDSRFTYTYDNQGNCSTGLHESWINGNWEYSNSTLNVTEKSILKHTYGSTYRIEVYRDGITSAEDQVLSILKDSKVSPNPFSNSATLSYEVASPGIVTIDIFNSLGEKVDTILNEYKESGSYKTDINSSSYPSGMYYYTIKSGNSTNTGRMVILK